MKVQPEGGDAESIILNVAGRLLMFQRDRTGPQVKVMPAGQNNKNKERPVSGYVSWYNA